MKKSLENVILIIIIGFVCIFIGSMLETSETLIVEGEVKHVFAYDDYMTIYFKDGTQYNVFYPDQYNLDLTKDSTVVLELYDYDLFWLDDGKWNCKQVIRIF